MPTSRARSEKLDLRVSGHVKQLLRAAADVRHETMSEFVLRTALREAEDVLMDRRRFELTDEQWAALNAVLDAPASAPSAALLELLSKPSVFE